MSEDDMGPWSWPLFVVLIPLGLISMCSSGDRRTAEEIEKLREEISTLKRER